MLDLYTATLGATLKLLSRDVDALGESVNWHIIHPEGVRLTEDIARSATLCTEDRSGGLYAALNQVGNMSGDARWLSYINDDDRLLCGFSRMFNLHLEQSDERVIAFGRVIMLDEAGNALYDFPISDRMQDLAALWAEGVMPFTQQGMIFSRMVWNALGGYDESYRYSGDLDFWVRAHFAGFRFKFYNFPVAAWRIRPGQLSANKEAVQLETNRALAPIRALTIPWRRRQMAKLRFRLRNLPHYAQRIIKLGRLRQAAVFR